MKKPIKNIIIIAAIIILGVIGYMVFAGKKDTGGALQTTAGLGVDTSGSASAAATADSSTGIGRDLLTVLLNLKSINLDNSIFSNKEFVLLQDFNRPIPPDNDPGRANPFAPLGADTTVISTQISTSNPSSITPTSSMLNGTLTVSGASITRWFEYGPTSALGMMTTPKTQLNPGAFAELVTGLLPNTTYYVRAGASISGSTVTGNVVTWKTAQGPK